MNREEIKVVLSTRGWKETPEGDMTKTKDGRCVKVKFTNRGLMFYGRNGTRGQYRLLGTKDYGTMSYDGKKICF